MAKFQDNWAVNWQDGMLVNAEHLTMSQQYLENTARRTLRILMKDYGLAWDPAEPSCDVSLSWEAHMIDKDIVQVEIMSCRAVTQDGTYIAIFKDTGDKAPKYIARKQVPIDSSSKFSVYIVASHNKYHEIGIQD
ncbi:hypothetical protein JW979_15290, partial [bacterium]|nr:hypothetical protein [candidate division CSSED10-310 bacterium]